MLASLASSLHSIPESPINVPRISLRSILGNFSLTFRFPNSLAKMLDRLRYCRRLVSVFCPFKLTKC